LSTLSDTYRWVGSHYEKEDEADLLRCISTYATTKIVQTKAGPKTNFATSSFIQEALKMLRLMTRINPACLNPGGCINCRNGVLRVHWQHGSLRLELLPDTPDLVFTSPPACADEPEACRDHLDRMLGCLDPEQRDLWLDVAGASLAVAEVRRLRGRIPAVFQLGQGSNGKDTLNSCLQALHGEGAVARVTISDFRGFDAGSGAGRFKVQDLAGARLNIAGHVPLDRATGRKGRRGDSGWATPHGRAGTAPAGGLPPGFQAPAVQAIGGDPGAMHQGTALESSPLLCSQPIGPSCPARARCS